MKQLVEKFVQDLTPVIAADVAKTIITALLETLKKEYRFTDDDLWSLTAQPVKMQVKNLNNICKKYNVVFTQTVGAKPLQLIKDVRDFFSIELEKAKDLVTEATIACKLGNVYEIATFDSIENAIALKKKLEKDGAEINIIEVEES